jgi:mRNA interferase MazF
VVSSDGVGRLPVKLVAPLMEWKDAFEDSAWLIRIEPDPGNRLSKTSAADVLQLRGMDLRRFVSRLGRLSPEVMDEIAAAVAIVVEFDR